MPKFNLNDYETVEVRIAKFWAAHPDGRILTDLVSYGDQFIFRAEVYRDAEDDRPWASGYAEEVTGSSPVNRTSALENCETSAIGRALANAGYATKGKRPSREEMAKAQRAQESEEVPVASAAAVSGAVDAFAAAESMDVLASVAQHVAGMNVSDADRDILRAAYTQAKERIEAT